jgi:hypothetical protein
VPTIRFGDRTPADLRPSEHRSLGSRGPVEYPRRFPGLARRHKVRPPAPAGERATAMILEAIVTTLSLEDVPNVAPMGPRITDPLLRRFELRPYRSSKTYGNLKAQGEGVLHITDDVLLLARAVIGQLKDVPSKPADMVRGRILTDCCRYYEFRVVALDDHVERATIQAETVASGRFRDFLGFNRARNAVVEAAVLASRTRLLPRPEILSEFHKLGTIVARTGGMDEQLAFLLLDEYVRNAAPETDFDPDEFPT